MMVREKDGGEEAGRRVFVHLQLGIDYFSCDWFHWLMISIWAVCYGDTM